MGGRKRKQREAEAAAPVKKDEAAPERPKRTLLGWKDKVGDEKESDSKTTFRNKEKVLVTCSRRISYRYRHLMMNVVSLLPHCKKDNKVESKESKGATLNELVELKSCSSCMFFECRKQKDLYLWMAKCPNGPSVKFLVNAVHTMEELKLTGNHLKGSRPILTFSNNFDKPHWKLLKEIIMQIFGVPKDHRKSKPYHDHVFVFSIVDDHIWFRNYQISAPHSEMDKVDRGGLDKMTLVEVGPRFCLNPIKIFGGSFGGPTLYENPFYISPNQVKEIFIPLMVSRSCGFKCHCYDLHGLGSYYNSRWFSCLPHGGGEIKIAKPKKDPGELTKMGKSKSMYTSCGQKCL